VIDMRQNAVDDYIKRLERSMRDVPASRRNEIVAEIREHLNETLAHLPPDATEADVRNAIESVGEPDDIASEARDRLGIRPVQARWTDTAAVILLPIGGVILPFFGWVIGLIFLWMSSVWTTKEKILGTLIVPGGLLPALYLTLVPTRFRTCTQYTVDGTTVSECSGPNGTNVIMLILGIALLVAPILIAVYLGRRLRTRTASVTR
jgi:uncharacterized membrane protein